MLWLSQICPCDAYEQRDSETHHKWDVGAFSNLQECKRRGLKVVVAGIPKTIDNDIEVSRRCAHWCNLRFSTLLLVVSTWQICYKLGNPTFERSCSFSNY